MSFVDPLVSSSVALTEVQQTHVLNSGPELAVFDEVMDSKTMARDMGEFARKSPEALKLLNKLIMNRIMSDIRRGQQRFLEKLREHRSK